MRENCVLLLPPLRTLLGEFAAPAPKILFASTARRAVVTVVIERGRGGAAVAFARHMFLSAGMRR